MKVADYAPLVYTPGFFDPSKAYQWYRPNLDGAYIEGVELAKKRDLANFAELMKAGIKNAAMLTDLQSDFRGKSDQGVGRLPVQGTDDVVLRVCARLINGTVQDHYSGLIWSEDGHSPNHISYGANWIDRNGMPLDPRKHGNACILELFDESKAVFVAKAFGPDGTPYEVGHYQRRFDPRDTVNYWKHLQATGQGPIWVFNIHCVLGTEGVSLHPLLQEVVAFMCGARMIEPTIVFKGHINNTDWFGPFEPCRPDSGHPQGRFQKDIVDQFRAFDTVEFSGVAEDFCDFNAKRQVMKYFDGTEFFGKMFFLSDGTAPIIPNAPHVQELNKEARDKGVKFITHDSPFGQLAAV